MKVGWNVLQNTSRSLQAHTGIDIFAREWPKIIRWFTNTVELSEHEIPDFNRLTIFQLVIDFTAWAANAVRTQAGSASGPEVFIFFHARDALRWQANFAVPNVGCFIIIFVNGNAQAICWDTEPFRLC